MTARASVSVAVAVGMAISLSAAAAAAAAEPSADPPSRTVSLRGPFGTVAGTDPQAPAVAAPDGRALDAWQRDAAMELAIEPPLDVTATVTLKATPDDGGEAVELSLEDGRWVTGPGRAGDHVVVASIERDGRTSGEFAWLIEVPDRPGDIETLLTMPALEASVSAASGTVPGERGHGCHVDMCQEVGFRPPATALEPLDVQVGEPVTFSLADGSAVIGWEGRLEPQPGTASETRFAEAVFEEPVGAPVLTGLEPDAVGEWLLELRADYDRERGWGWYLFRLVAE